VRVFAPGKLVLTGAYAVLHGAPAVVLATSRGAIAEGAAIEPAPTREVRAAIGETPAPAVDASALFDGPRKLGLGASAAILVASLGAIAARGGEDLGAADVRARIFRRARAAHALAQGGGSGVDVGAAVHGGLLVYTPAPWDAPRFEPAAMPQGLVVRAWFSGESARTSDLLARVVALAARDKGGYRASLSRLERLAEDARGAVLGSDVVELVAAVRATCEALADLGHRADAPIVTSAFASLATAATREEGAFVPSGAGGGDVGVWVGCAPPSHDFDARARALGMTPIDLSPDPSGLRLEDPHG
jgi:phosphomevalonate kinase